MQKTNTANVAHLEQIQLPKNAEMIRLGVEAEEFLSSNVGRFLMKKAFDEAVDATNKIRSLNSSDKGFSAEYDRLQNEINRHKDFERWISEAINIGNQAFQQYQEEFNEE